MEEIKKFLRLMDKESLVDLVASMLFTQLATMVDLEKALKMLHKEWQQEADTKSLRLSFTKPFTFTGLY